MIESSAEMNVDVSVENPFPGLRPFEMEEYHLFFGRDGQSDELLARLGRTRFLAVVGTSGSGKSSLVRAGLLPALHGGLMAGAGSGWRVALFRPGGDPVGELARALGAEGVLGTGGDVQTTIIETTLRRGARGIVDAVNQAQLPAHENVLVVVDQFEELFRFKEAGQSASDDASAFVKLLLEASAQREFPIYVVLTMRSDFLGDCARFQGLPEAINVGQYLIPRMTRDERSAAITGPVAVGGGEITQPLVNRLLNDVGDNPDQLPILQHALMRTWNFWTTHARNGEPLDLPHYEAIGTMSDALSRHADEAYGELADESRRLIAEKMFKALTEKGADNRETRRPTRLAELCEITGASLAEVVSVIELFRREGRSFLMPPAEVALDEESVIDISHESLIRNWTRLKKWTDEEAQSARIYRRLAESAVLHREGREGLLNDPALQIALDWRDGARPNAAWGRRYHPEYAAAVAHLDESRAHRDAQVAAEREREQRELERTRAFAEQQALANRKLRALMFAFALLALFAMGTAAYAYIAKKRAESSEQSALVEKKRAEDAKLEAEKLTIELQRSGNELKARTEDLQKSVTDFEQAEAGRIEQTEIAQRRAEAELKARRRAQVAAAQARAAELEAKRKAEALAANARFRDAAVLSQRGEFSKAGGMLQDVIKSMEAVNDLEGVADTYNLLGDLHFGLNGDFKEAVENFDRAADLYLRVNAPAKAAEVHAATGAQLMRFAAERDKYVKYEATHQDFKTLLGDCRRRERVNNLSYQPTRLCSIPSIITWSTDEVREAEREQYLKAYADYERAGDRDGMADMAFKIAENHFDPFDDDDKEARSIAAYYYEKLLTLFPNDADIARILLRLAVVQHLRDEDASVVTRYTDRVLNLYRNDPPDALALTEIGQALRETNQTGRALAFYEAALASYRRAGATTLEARALYEIGIARNAATSGGVSEKAMEAFTLAVERYRQDAGSGGRQDVSDEFFNPLFDIGSFAQTNKNGALAQAAYETALAYGKREENTALQARAYLALGYLNQSLARYGAARTYYEPALSGYRKMRELARETNDTRQLEILDAKIGEVERSLALIEAEAARGKIVAPTP